MVLYLTLTPTSTIMRHANHPCQEPKDCEVEMLRVYTADAVYSSRFTPSFRPRPGTSNTPMKSLLPMPMNADSSIHAYMNQLTYEPAVCH